MPLSDYTKYIGPGGAFQAISDYSQGRAPSQRKPAPSPKGQISQIPQALPNIPAPPSIRPMSSKQPAQQVRPQAGSYRAPASTGYGTGAKELSPEEKIQQVIDIMGSGRSSGSGGARSPGVYYKDPDPQIPRSFGLEESGAGTARSGGPGAQRRPMQAIPIPDLPQYQSPEFKPPEEGPRVDAAARREAMAPGLRELREGTREAISSAQSLDNPNARSKFIQNALKGYGQGLERVAAGAQKEGRQAAQEKDRRAFDIYKIQYDVKSDEYMMNYQNKINTIASEFAQQQAIQAQGYNAGATPNQGVGTPNPVAWKQAGFSRG